VVLPQSAAPSRILFIGGVPAKTHAAELEQQLAVVCGAAGLQPTMVQVGHNSRVTEGYQLITFVFGYAATSSTQNTRMTCIGSNTASHNSPLLQLTGGAI
jgi:hypothetical protein